MQVEEGSIESVLRFSGEFPLISGLYSESDVRTQAKRQRKDFLTERRLNTLLTLKECLVQSLGLTPDCFPEGVGKVPLLL